MDDNRNFKQGDLYIANLGNDAISQTGSHVQGGIRPVVLVQNNAGNFFAPTLIVVPITSKVWKKPSQPTHYLIHQTQGLRSDGIALGEQITTIDKRQCLKYIGRLSPEDTAGVRAAAMIAIGGIEIPEDVEAP